MFERIDQGFAASPVSSTTAADVSSQDVSIPRISIGPLQEAFNLHFWLSCNSAFLPCAKALFNDSA